jgi:hypothetical protein
VKEGDFMNELQIRVLKKARRTYQRVSKKRGKYTFGMTNVLAEVKGQEASDRIAQGIEIADPLLVARIGDVELFAVLTYIASEYPGGAIRKAIRYILGESYMYWWDEFTLHRLLNDAGFFPLDEKYLVDFCNLYLRDLKEIDILGSYLSGEVDLLPYFGKVTFTTLQDLEPFSHVNPWTAALEGKRVLVVHPFADSIQKQYQSRRDKLFLNKDMLPEFRLETVEAVQSIGGCKPEEHGTWFEALEYLKERVDVVDFDVAIIGCGAYGLPLGAHITRKKKIAIHLGGATQLLFGIKGKRWDQREFYRNLYNEYWVRPSKEEIPLKMNDSAPYW